MKSDIKNSEVFYLLVYVIKVLTEIMNNKIIIKTNLMMKFVIRAVDIERIVNKNKNRLKIEFLVF